MRTLLLGFGLIAVLGLLCPASPAGAQEDRDAGRPAPAPPPAAPDAGAPAGRGAQGEAPDEGLEALEAELRAEENEEEGAGEDGGEGAPAGSEQEEEAETGEQPQPIPTPEIGRQMEETFRDLAELAPFLRRQPEVAAIRRDLPELSAAVRRALQSPQLDSLDTLSPRRLHNRRQEWRRLKERSDAWGNVLERRISDLTEERARIRGQQRLWRVTLRADRDEPLPESQRQRIGVLEERIDRVIHRLDLRIAEVLALQGQLSDQGIKMNSTVARIESALSSARQRRYEADAPPLWRGLSKGEETSTWEQLAQHAGELREDLANFLDADSEKLRAHFGIWLLATLLLLYASRAGRKGKPPPVPRDRRAPLAALLHRPISATILLFAMPVPLLYPHMPLIALDLVTLALVPALLRIGPLLAGPSGRLQIYLGTCGAATILVDLFYPGSVVRRILLLLLSVAGFLAYLSLFRPGSLDRRLSLSLVFRRVDSVLRLAPLALLGAALTNLFGYQALSDLWLIGVATATAYAVILGCTVTLATAALPLMIRSRIGRSSRIAKRRPYSLFRSLRSGLRWAGAVGWVALAADAFDRLDPTLTWLRQSMRESYRIGTIDLSLGEVTAFLVVAISTVLVVRLISFLLEDEVLPRFGLKRGVPQLVALMVRYFMLGLGIILAFGAAGVDLEHLQLLGGALGVGIGFGLQNIVRNFVAGLILIAERPIKVGDIVEHGDLVGEVKRIGIRSSTIQSLAGAEVIVPNSSLISDQLINWTLSTARRRIEIQVGVSYDSSPKKVMGVLEGVVKSHRSVLEDPPPEVLCIGFGDSSIDYEVRAWTLGYREGISVQSDLTMRIYAALEEAGLEIPYPRREVHVVSGKGSSAGEASHLEEAAQSAGERAAEKGG